MPRARRWAKMAIFDFTRWRRLVRRAGCLDGGHDGVNDRLHRHLLGNGVKSQDQAVPQHTVGQGLDVLRDDVVPAVEERHGPGAWLKAMLARGLAPNSMNPASRPSMYWEAFRVT